MPVKKSSVKKTAKKTARPQAKSKKAPLAKPPVSLDALLEIGCEELPVDYIAPALRQMQAQAESALREARLAFAAIEVEATPRRLVLKVQGLAAKQAELAKVIQGPTVRVAYQEDGSLTPAGEGFLRKLGLKPDQVEVKDDRLWARVEEPGLRTRDLLPELFVRVIKSLSFPKSMRWESSGVRFARPVRWLVALLGSEVVPLTFADVTSGRITRLHPLHTPLTASVAEVKAYEPILRKGRVILSVAERRSQLQAALQHEAKHLGGRIVADEELLDMVVMMAEQPAVVSGAFDQKYLAVAREIVVTAMREHQRYFALEDEAGRLLPHFLAVYDNPLAKPAAIRPGCERVLDARLKDAEFFFQEDLKHPLAELVPQLERVLWIKNLGNLLDKTRRLEKLAGWLAQHLEPAEAENAQAAAHLAKADLITNMVQEKEFTSLQGTMGSLYALAQGVCEPVAVAIREQYQPRSAEDQCPQTPAGRMLALADKLDHLAGCWGAGFIPTGAKDPYALRRAAQGVVAITLGSHYRFSLQEAIRQAVELFAPDPARSSTVVSEIKTFILGRMETELANRHYPPDMIQALLAVWTDDLTALVQKAEAMTQLMSWPDFSGPIIAFSRVVNIIPKSTPRDLPPDTPELSVQPELLEAASERELQQAILQIRHGILELGAAGDFAGIFRWLAGLTPLINRFFDEVMVMAPDMAVRTNRLNLLTNLARCIWMLADFSRLVMAKEQGQGK